MSADPLHSLIERWRADPGATYQSWFLWDERLKNFRSIRRGIAEVVDAVEADTFGSRYKGSLLETVVGSVAEQRQIFKGADHAFLWKPKLRIPDIYENRENQLAFGRFLHACTCCDTEQQVLGAIRQLDARRIKGLGPAAANLLYFLHPTLVPPFNTAIVRGFNGLTGSKVKLGRWDEYLAMRQRIIELNKAHERQLSNDLGAIAGLLFDIGTDRYAAPPAGDDGSALARWEEDLASVREESAAAGPARNAEADRTHTEIQGWLRDLGRALGYDVWIAANDRSRPWELGRLGDGCLAALPPLLERSPFADSVRLIDVLWLEPGEGCVAAAFEVEHTTSIYSGIMRLLDLALGAPSQALAALFLVAPAEREADVRAQLCRPAFSRIASLQVRYLPYDALAQHREAIARFGTGLKGIDAIARRV
jgi:type II restriction enzyme